MSKTHTNNGYPVRLDAKLMADVRRMARKEHRSLKAQLEVLVRAALEKVQG